MILSCGFSSVFYVSSGGVQLLVLELSPLPPLLVLVPSVVSLLSTVIPELDCELVVSVEEDPESVLASDPVSDESVEEVEESFVSDSLVEASPSSVDEEPSVLSVVELSLPSEVAPDSSVVVLLPSPSTGIVNIFSA